MFKLFQNIQDEALMTELYFYLFYFFVGFLAAFDNQRTRPIFSLFWMFMTFSLLVIVHTKDPMWDIEAYEFYANLPNVEALYLKREFIYFKSLQILTAILSFKGALLVFDLVTILVVRDVFRLLKLLRYSKAIDRLKIAFSNVKNELIIFSVACVFFIYFSAAGVYFFENEVQPENFKSIFHAIWWAVATLSTVGYGDVYPITIGGKIFTSIVIFLGLGLIAVPTGLIASSFGEAFRKED